MVSSLAFVLDMSRNCPRSRPVNLRNPSKFAYDAASNGRDCLRECLADAPRDDLRKLAVAAGIEARRGHQWLPVGQLRGALLEAISPTKEDGMCQGVFRFVSSFDFFDGLAHC